MRIISLLLIIVMMCGCAEKPCEPTVIILRSDLVNKCFAYIPRSGSPLFHEYIKITGTNDYGYTYDGMSILALDDEFIQVKDYSGSTLPQRLRDAYEGVQCPKLKFAHSTKW
jgi:hypothetical protein